MAFQGEIFQNLCSVLALLLVLRPLSRGERPSLLLMVTSRSDPWRSDPDQAVGAVRHAGLSGRLLHPDDAQASGTSAPTSAPALSRSSCWESLALVPTIAVILLYSVMGLWGCVVRRQCRGAPGLHPAWIAPSAPTRMARHVGADAALDRRTSRRSLGSLADDRRRARCLLFLGIWVIAVILCQLFLRIASDHYFLQFLPPLCLLTGLALARGLLIHLPHRQDKGGHAGRGRSAASWSSRLPASADG